jgi:hypothetical protein
MVDQDFLAVRHGQFITRQFGLRRIEFPDQ